MKDVICDTLRKFKHRVDYLEIRTESRRVLSLSADKTGPVHSSKTDASGGCVRANIGGGWGFASFESLDRLDSYVEKAIAWASMSNRGKYRLASAPVVVEDVPLK